MPYIPTHARRELDFPGLIARGASGMKARRVQEWLAFHQCTTSVDGAYGPATEAAVRAFQQKAGFSATGQVDEETWAALVDPLLQPLSVDVAPSTTHDSAVLTIAQAHLLQHPIELGGDNRGPWVRLYTGGSDGPEWRWCAAFVTFVLKQTCDALGRSMPIPGSSSCDSLAYQAQQSELFVPGKSLEDGSTAWSDLGQCGIFLVRKSPTDWTHTGLCFDGAESVFSTIEGNTNNEHSDNGYEVCQQTRSVAKKDFILIPN